MGGLVVTIGVVATLSIPGVAAAADEPPSLRCVGLTCAEPGSPDDVPEARGVLPSVWEPSQLEKQTTAGFYEFGSGTLGKRSVAYVAPYGDWSRLPASVRDLPVVSAIASLAPSELDPSTIVIFGPGAASIHPLDGQAVSTARRQSPRARAANPPPNYDCPDQHLCLYDADNWQSSVFTFSGPFYNGTGWWRLSDWGWGDRANSVRNRRGYDGLLNRNWPPNGAQYCSDSHSSDLTLSNNIGNNEASAIANVPDDIHC